MTRAVSTRSKRQSPAVEMLQLYGKISPGWAKETGFPVRTVIYGHNKGHYLQSHKIAVAGGPTARAE